MIGKFLLLTKLEEVSQELIIDKLMTSKKRFDPKRLAKGLALMDRNARNIAKRKGIRAAMAQNMDAVVHATRHPKIASTLKHAQYGGAESSTWPFPWHVWMK